MPDRVMNAALGAIEQGITVQLRGFAHFCAPSGGAFLIQHSWEFKGGLLSSRAEIPLHADGRGMIPCPLSAPLRAFFYPSSALVVTSLSQRRTATQLLTSSSSTSYFFDGARSFSRGDRRGQSHGASSVIHTSL